MSKEEYFRVEFRNNWKKFRDTLRNSCSEVIKETKGTSLEDNFSQWYEQSVPQKRESPIRFLLRNARNSYATTSQHHSAELESTNILAKIGWHFRKIPVFRRIIRLEEISTELYLGQETRGYISDRQEIKGDGFGNDCLRYVSSNFARPIDLDIDVGFTNHYRLRNGRNWFYQINVNDDSLTEVAKRIYDIIRIEKIKIEDILKGFSEASEIKITGDVSSNGKGDWRFYNARDFNVQGDVSSDGEGYKRLPSGVKNE